MKIVPQPLHLPIGVYSSSVVMKVTSQDGSSHHVLFFVLFRKNGLIGTLGSPLLFLLHFSTTGPIGEPV